MRQNLKARLGRYHNTGKNAVAPKAGERRETPKATGFDESAWPGWVEAGFKTLKREVPQELSFPLHRTFAGALPLLVLDIFRFGRLPQPQELLFFDLETTGLSGGAGTVAFLAALGRFDISSDSDCLDKARLIITQYLLLDYPGENDFIEKVVADLLSDKVTARPLVVSFNGKSFDSQILKSRCLMNRIKVPEYCHADLLHPARRLWKKTLTDCSQATIETSVLGLDREGDVSGAMAPDIWFSFLRTGENRELLSVCDHNLRDITGLSSLFLAMGEIAADPVGSRKRFRFNEEALALFWHKALKRRRYFAWDDESNQRYSKTGDLLLKIAAQNGSFHSAIVLAKNSEWRLGDFQQALHYTELALAFPSVPESVLIELEKRRSRLEEKMKRGNGPA